MRITPPKALLPYIALVCGVLALSVSALFVRWSNVPGTVTSFFRMALASIFLFPFWLRDKRQHPPLDGRWVLLAMLGGVFTAMDHGFWSTALSYTRVANATLLNNIDPLWVALFAFTIWHEKLPPRFWLGLALALAGATVVLGSDFAGHPQFSTGDLLALVSSVFYAGYFLVAQRCREHMSSMAYLWVATLTAAVALMAVNLGLGYTQVGYSLPTILAFFGVALISQIGGIYSLVYALGHLPASVVSPTMIAQPVLTALIAIPVAGEPLSLAQLAGGATVLLGIYLVNRNHSETQHIEAPAV
ncbi:MAG: DMT family transporter [Anaerolineaceae bacterium]|jgi:drug/metabolite transporter (DMT)-like permease